MHLLMSALISPKKRKQLWINHHKKEKQKRIQSPSTLKHYSVIIKDVRTHPRFLFKTVDQLVNPVSPCVPVESDADCEMFFLSYFTDKVKSNGAYITHNAAYSDVNHLQQDHLNQFYPITLLSSCLLDIIPTKFLLKSTENNQVLFAF